MNRFQLFLQLRRHRQLAERRALNFQQNKVAKWVMGFLSVFMVGYLIFFAVIFSLVANESSYRTPLETIMGILPFVLLVDFFLRFTAQQTPSQLVKPYLTLPISRYACVDTFVITSMISATHLLWMFLFVPYALMSIVFSFGIGKALIFLLVAHLLVVANSQWYLICRTKIIDSQFWWLLPIAVYALMAMPLYVGKKASLSQFVDIYGTAGTWIEEMPWLPVVLAIALLAILAGINRILQYRHILSEALSEEKTTLKSVSKFNFLDRYGEVGEYLKLEVKSILRNKNPRKSFIMSTAVVIMFSLLITFTPVYDGNFFTNFWCIYNLVIYGAMSLTRVMCYEGNYIDALMVHKENIISLFRAKYWFSCALLVLPFALMLPTVFAGKWSIWMLLAYTLYTAGAQYFLLFQMAVYNKQTIPLNAKFIGKNSMENNYMQLVVQMVVFFIPILLASVLQALGGEWVCNSVMAVIGIAFILTNRLWLQNIYKRMMVRRYENMASFRASR